MRRTLSALCAAGLLSLSLTACGGDDFCEAGDEALGDVDMGDPNSTIEALESLRDDAPSEIQDDIDVIIEQTQLAMDDPASVDVDAITEAGDNLGTWQEENC